MKGLQEKSLKAFSLTSGGLTIFTLLLSVEPVPKSFFVSDFANFRTYVLKSLTQPHYAVLSVRNRLGLDKQRSFSHFLESISIAKS